MEINLNLFKDELINMIKNLTMKNLNSNLSGIKKVISIIESLHDSKFLFEEDIFEEKTKENNGDILLKNEYVFKKKLTGGTIIGIPNSFLAESVIREIGLETGDIVYIGNKNNIQESLRKVTGKREEGIEEDFVLYKYCEVKNDEGIYLFCDESINQGKHLIKLDDIPYKYVIPEFVKEKFNISEGDMVDLGYEKTNPYNMKIVWRHNQEIHKTPLASSNYKDKTEKFINPLFQSIDFEKCNICVIGCEPRKTYYQEAINECNGEFLFSSGEEQLERMLSVIDKADVVLILKDFLSHTAVKKAVEHSKLTQKPFSVVDGLGIQTVIFEARKLVAEIEEVKSV